MPPDQLPAGLRVKALKWEPWGNGYRSDKYLVFPENGWLACFDGALIAEKGWKFFNPDV